MAKTVHQIVTVDGKSAAVAKSAPGWFIDNHQDVLVSEFEGVAPSGASIQWGPVFSGPESGNLVDFFTTGEDYFKKVAAEISGAQKSVFIAGWQVNFDVLLDGKKSLFDCLLAALKNGADVYVMPWLAPPGPVDTGYFLTTLAVFHLNAAPGVKGRAHCLPAPAQSDQGTAGIAYAHHQKQVVIDNKRAFMGGIDLAYGRRDDANFSLKAGDRTLNEFYNSCVPTLHNLTKVEMQDCVTAAELLSASFTRGTLRFVTTFVTSPSEGVIAKGLDIKAEVAEGISTATKPIIDAWNNINLFKDVTNYLQDAAMDAAQATVTFAYDKLDGNIRGKIDTLRTTGSAHAANAGAALIAWLNGADLSRLPPQLLDEASSVIFASVFGAVAGINAATDTKPEYYERLFKKTKAIPAGAVVHDGAIQPRMPWHDVQCMIEGPSVFALNQNFVLRWNGVAKLLETSFAYYNNALAKELFRSLGWVIPTGLKAPRIASEHVLAKPDLGNGTCWVQVLRSASVYMQQSEAIAQGKTTMPRLVQNNCMKAMVKAITSAQQFIYIEGQFFQTAHGDYGPTSAVHSGPMGSLLNLQKMPEYDEFLTMLGIKGVQPKDMLGKIRWAKIDDILRLAKGKQFSDDFLTVLKNLATVEAMRLLGKPQRTLINPVGKALINRITRAIDDGQDFHVYMVLPVHPEGTLDTLNIMSQIHLTMHSLVFGEHSLVNGIRRAMLTEHYRKKQNLNPKDAKAKAAKIQAAELETLLPEQWQKYLTLLNLRNWDTLGGKAVTEQVYVHSKLLIADDRVAVLGSANINDRSQLGDRDSELAVIITDETPKQIKLDGQHPEPVSSTVYKLRRALWEKHFGLKSSNRKASALASDAILDCPGAPATWKAIQEVASNNERLYNTAFWFTPRSSARSEVQTKEPKDKQKGPPPASLWPLWRYVTYLNHAQGGKLLYPMPFQKEFWEVSAKLAPVAAGKLNDVEGFIVSLPINWTRRENNLSIATHIGVLAVNDVPSERDAATDGQSIAKAPTNPTQDLV